MGDFFFGDLNGSTDQTVCYAALEATISLHHFGVTEMHRSELFGLIFSVDGFARGAPPALRKSRLWHGPLRADVTSSTDQKLNMFGRGGR